MTRVGPTEVRGLVQAEGNRGVARTPWAHVAPGGGPSVAVVGAGPRFQPAERASSSLWDSCPVDPGAGQEGSLR